MEGPASLLTRERQQIFRSRRDRAPSGRGLQVMGGGKDWLGLGGPGTVSGRGDSFWDWCYSCKNSAVNARAVRRQLAGAAGCGAGPQGEGAGLVRRVFEDQEFALTYPIGSQIMPPRMLGLRMFELYRKQNSSLRSKVQEIC